MKDHLFSAFAAVCIWNLCATFYLAYEINGLSKEVRRLRENDIRMERIIEKSVIIMETLVDRHYSTNRFLRYLNDFPKGTNWVFRNLSVSNINITVTNRGQP